jgi:hypothetical protein
LGNTPKFYALANPGNPLEVVSYGHPFSDPPICTAIIQNSVLNNEA